MTAVGQGIPFPKQGEGLRTDRLGGVGLFARLVTGKKPSFSRPIVWDCCILTLPALCTTVSSCSTKHTNIHNLSCSKSCQYCLLTALLLLLSPAPYSVAIGFCLSWYRVLGRERALETLGNNSHSMGGRGAGDVSHLSSLISQGVQCLVIARDGKQFLTGVLSVLGMLQLPEPRHPPPK